MMHKTMLLAARRMRAEAAPEVKGADSADLEKRLAAYMASELERTRGTSPPGMADQAALYLQIKQWIDLENRTAELQRMLDGAISEKTVADMRAEASIHAERVAMADLTVARGRITELEAPKTVVEDANPLLMAAREENARLTSILQRKSVDDVAIHQIIEAAKSTRRADPPDPKQSKTASKDPKIIRSIVRERDGNGKAKVVDHQLVYE